LGVGCYIKLIIKFLYSSFSNISFSVDDGTMIMISFYLILVI
jgi:hypothetical protein